MVAPAAPAHRRASSLALYATCGDLVVAFAIVDVVRVHLAETVTARPRAAGSALSLVQADDERLAGWDLGSLLGQRRPTSASTWIVLAHGPRRRFAVACDRSLAVRPLRVELPLAATMFGSRVGAVQGAFTTAALGSELELAPTGLLLSAARLLAAEELQAATAAAAEGLLSW